MTTKNLTPEQFSALPKTEKAVLIAKDVILQVKQKLYAAERMTYLYQSKRPQIKNSEGLDDISTASKEGKAFIKQSKCLVCMKGSAFLASIQRSNKMSIQELLDARYDSEMSMAEEMDKKVCKIDKVFTKKEFDDMEEAFELCNCFAGDVFPKAKNKKPSADKVMVAICLNIIANGGSFNSKENIPTAKDVRKALAR